MTRATPSVGIGERRSNTKGAGLEFAEHRPYRAGDDVRHLDPRVMARLGESYIRQYFVDRQLPIFILLDGTRSMLAGTPQKFATAAQIAQVAAFVGLSSGDRVRVGVSGNSGFRWSQALQGGARADILFNWFSDIEPGDRTDFGADIERAVRDMGKAAYVVVVSDWWDERMMRALDVLEGQGHDILGIQVAAPEEIDPTSLGNGSVLLVDDETGDEVETVIDEAVVTDYRNALKAFQATLRQRLVRSGGRFFALSSAADISRFFLRDLRAAGVLL
ncbi:DUF58 domain-containing protein [Devosia aurantiaca]|uniref:DUF58 domain-containing protein n=1 Tax=Devosia aurantiaca TaxID=2714858 RepID=A0A6M1SJB1_9HYPH|nr:DUF58 domain-containing protein [Devosia aurantiaca]NGP17210.1 DUF58 domain-containing protein [Devosia aurantiaca]